MLAERPSRRFRQFRNLCLLLPAIALLFVAGCGKPDPVRKLYEQKVQIKFKNPNARAFVDTLKFPREADDETVALLTGSAFSKVREIDLSGTRITNEALKTIGELTSLESLNLNDTNIDDEGLKHLTELSSLQVLRLGDTLVTGDGLKEHVTKLSSLTTLALVGKPKPKPPKERSWQTAFRLGIDLAGGTNLVYQVVPTDEKEITGEVMDQMVGAVKKRIDPAGTEEITVRKVGTDRIEVIIPHADPEVVAEKKRLMTRLGSLEFAMLANEQKHAAIISKAEKVERDLREERVIDGEKVSVLVAGWRDVALDAEGNPKDISDHGRVKMRAHPTNKELSQFLVVFGPPNERILGKYLSRASAGQDNNGRPAVNFEWNTRGATLFARLTGSHLPTSEQGFKHRLAILLDGKIHSAPQINSQIGASGIIEGKFTKEEVDELVSVLNAGALALPFKTGATGQPAPISEQTISPLLGQDVREKGQFAIIVAALMVFVFMLVYYRFSGFVADLALLLNLVLVMGTMAFIDAAFTLPGLAGIVLTIGMAVDANVLIFERIREEQNRGSSLRMSIQNGFGRAFTTIVDANLTTLITAVVLYMIGTDQVRGFAVTLFIGIVMSMFTALYFGRLIFDICERKRLIKDLKMFSIVGSTNWNFLNKKSIAAVVSAVVIVAGLVGVFTRGNDLLDIDLDGGSMVTVEFEKTQSVKDLKEVLSKSAVLVEGLTIEELSVTADEAATEGSRRYRIRGKEKKPEKFKQAIYETLMEADSQKYALRQVKLLDFDPSQIEEVKSTENELVPSEYVGGHRVVLSLSGEGMKPSTLETYLAFHLAKIGTSPSGADEGSAVYERPAELIRVDPLTPDDKPDQTGGENRVNKVRVYVTEGVKREHLVTALKDVEEQLATQPVFPEVMNFDSAVAGDMQRSAILAMLFSLVAIIAYIWFRFQRATFGIAAVCALVHDVLVVLGVVALAGFISSPWLDFKINLPMIAAFLTIVGYSLNDTIVVFDRVREVRGKNPALTDDMVNTSLNQTLARTLLTSLTTFIVVAILYGWGGEGIRGFAFCLVLGIIVGTYSSIYVASPVLLWLMNRPGSKTSRATTVAAGR